MSLRAFQSQTSLHTMLSLQCHLQDNYPLLTCTCSQFHNFRATKQYQQKVESKQRAETYAHIDTDHVQSTRDHHLFEIAVRKCFVYTPPGYIFKVKYLFICPGIRQVVVTDAERRLPGLFREWATILEYQDSTISPTVH